MTTPTSCGVGTSQHHVMMDEMVGGEIDTSHTNMHDNVKQTKRQVGGMRGSASIIIALLMWANARADVSPLVIVVDAI